MGLSRQEYWSGLPFPSPVDLPDPGIRPGYPASQADSLPPGPPREAHRSTFTTHKKTGPRGADVSVCQRRSDFILRTNITTVHSGNVSSQS